MKTLFRLLVGGLTDKKTLFVYLLFVIFSLRANAQCPASITANPASASVCPGDSVTLTALPAGAISYQWFENGVLIPGATNSVFYAKDNSSYTVLVDACAISPAVNVVIKPLPSITITSDIDPPIICAGESITLTVTTGPQVIWFWVQPSGTSEGQSLPNPLIVSPILPTTYQLIGANLLTGCLNTSSIEVFIDYPIIGQVVSSDQTICSGSTPAPLSCTAPSGGNGTYTYQWQHSNSTTGGAFIDIPGATATTYAPGPLTETTIFRRMAISPPCTPGISTPATITVNQHPVITSPATITTCTGNSVAYSPASNSAGSSFSWTASVTMGTVTGFSASGSGPVINDILQLPAGATTSGQVTYVITPTGPAPTFCSGTASSIVVTVNPLPALTNAILTQTICAGDFTSPVILTSNLAGSTFQLTGSAPAGITNFIPAGTGNIPAHQIFSSLLTSAVVTYTLTPVGPAPSFCPGTPVIYTVQVDPAPTVTNSPLDQTICSGSTTSAVALTSNMVGTTFAWSAVANPATITGFDVSGTSIIPAQTIINNSNIAGSVTYTITPSGAIGTCPAINRDYVIYVNPIPVATAIPANPSICTGSNTGISLTSPVVPTTFNWTATGDPNISGFSDGSGNSISQTLTNSTNAPGTVTYTITPTAFGCSGNPVVVIVTVNPIPAVTNALLSSSVCSGTTTNIALTSDVAGTQFNYVVTSSIGVTGSASGTGTNISQTLVNTTNLIQKVTYNITPLANGCSGTAVDYAVTVYPTATLTTSPLVSTFCSGNTTNIILTSNVAGATYSWTASAPATITGFAPGMGGSIIQTLNNTGTSVDAVTYVITPSANGCSGPNANYTVTVNPIPDAILNAGSQTICAGTASAAVNISSGVAGTTFAWTAMPSSLQISDFTASGNGDIPSQIINSTLSIIGTVTYTITPTANGCNGSPVIHTITVNPTPSVTNSPLAQAICSGSANTPVVLTSNIPLATFSWTATASSPALTGFPISGTSTIPSAFLFNSGSTPETVTYHIIPTSNMGMDCAGTPADYIITVNPLPSISSSLIGSICSESVFSYTITGNIPGSTFTWSRAFVPGILNPPSSGNTASISEVLINTTTSDINVTYLLTPYGTAPTLCPGSPANLVVTVRPLPSANAGSDIFIPNGTSTVLSGTASGNALPLTYSWTPAGMIASGVSTLTPATTNLFSNTLYTLVVSDASGCQKADQMQVIVTGSPLTVNPTTTASAVCEGGSAFLNASANGGSGSYFYTWSSVPAGFNSNLATVEVFPNVNTVYTVSVFDGFNTVSASVNVAVNVLPLQFAVIGGGEYCSGGTGVDIGLGLSETNVNYQLYLNGTPVGSPVTGTGVAFYFGNQTSAGTYTVVANNMISGCTKNMSGSRDVIINPLPVADAGIDLTIPYGTNANLAGSASGGTGSYSFGWTPPAYIASGSGTLTPATTNIYANTNFTLNVTDSKGCINTDQVTVFLSGGPLSVLATAFPNTICNDGSSSALLATPSGGSGTYTFSWTCSPPGSPFWSSIVANPTVTPVSTTIYTVVVSDGFNTASAQVTVTVNQLPVANTVTGGGSYCFGGAGVPIGLSSSEPGCSYQLMRGGFPDGLPLAGTGSAITFGLKTAAFTYTVDATNTTTGCFRSMAGSAIVVITPLPLSYIVTGGGAYPSGGSGLPVGLSDSQIGVSYQLFIDGIAIGSPFIGIGAAFSFGLQTAAGTYTVTATDPVTTCVNNMSGSAAISINSLPVIFDVIGGGNICAGDPGLAVGLNGSEAGVDYSLLLNGSNIGVTLPGTGTSLNFGSFTNAGSYTAKGTVIATGVSSSMNGSTFINVNPLPAIYLLSPSGLHCPGTIVRLNASQAGVNYTLFRDGLAVASLPGSGVAGFLDFGAQNIPGVYTISAVNSTTGCHSNMTGTCIISTSPQLFSIITVGNICSGDIIQLSGSQPGIVYQLLLNGSLNVGIPLAGTGSILDFGSPAAPGNYTVIASDPVTGCISTMTGNVTVSSQPTTNAGLNATICANSNVQLNGTAANFSGVLWSTSGNGTFDDATLLNARYTPGTNDITAGNATLTLTVYGVGGCISFPVTDDLLLTINPLPVAQAGLDGNVCSNGSFALNGTALNNTSVSWTGSGDGNFSSISLLNPLYFPGPGDRISGSVTLKLSVAGSLTCASASSADSLILTINPLPVANAGPDASICLNSLASLTGSALNSTSVLWLTSGDGTFSNPAATSTLYFPGIADNAIGSVQLTLTADGSSACVGSGNSDFMTLTINQLPLANAGIDDAVCATSNFPITTTTASNYSSLLWTSSGTGTFSNPLSLSPTYLPSASDAISGSVTLTLTAFSASCSPVSDNLTLTLNALPVISAGSDEAICEGNSFTINSASAANYTAISWSGTGSGLFTNTGSLTPTYTPSAADIANGSVMLILSATAIAPCTGIITDVMTLSVKHAPVANAGSDLSVCEGVPYTVADATAANYAGIIWTTSGTGLLANQNTLSPTYTASIADVAAGSVLLTLIASNAPCSDEIDTKVLTINGKPAINAGPDATTCATCTFNITAASASNINTLTWESSGSGTFSNAHSISPVYTPSAYDITQGSVTLTLVCDGKAFCGQVIDDMLLTITNSPTVDFTTGPACAGQPISFTVDTASSDIAAISSYHWDFGDGFSSPLMNPMHTFVSNGPFTVVLTITDTTGYTNTVSHNVTLTPLPVSFFGYSSPNCANQPIQFTDLSHTLNGYITEWIWEYGDGTPNDTITYPVEPNTSHLYSASGTYNVTLYITNSFGCNAMSTQSVIVTAKPYANFYFSGNCKDQIVSFTDASYPNGGGNVVDWAWNFGDPASGLNNTSNLTDPTHIYSAPGTYNVTLVITNFNNCQDTIVKAVTVNMPPVVDFGHGPVCLNTPAEFFADSIAINVNAVTDWLWDFADGVTTTTRNTIHPFTSPGTYLVSLTITDTAGCTNTIVHPVIVNPLPVAHFEIPVQNCAEQTVFFKNLSTTTSGYVVRWNWNFGDGSDTTISFPANPNVLHTFATGANYNVIMTITASDSCTAFESQTLTISPAPVADFDFDLTCFGTPVNFLDISQSNGGGMITGWFWNFGDPLSGSDNTSTSQNPQHLFHTSGLHTITLMVSTTNGCTDTLIRTLNITAAPMVDFTTGNHCENSPVSFMADASIMDIPAVDSWLWNFGDGFTSALQNPDHLYTGTGTFQVSLTITDTAGCVNSVTHEVKVIPMPIVNFGFSPTTCFQTLTHFTSQAIAPFGYIVEWHWDFGDGTGSVISFPSNPNVSHQYASYGTFSVTLTVTTNDSCSNSIVKTITVSPNPLANFSYQSSCSAGTASFEDQSQIGNTGSITDWLWNFGDPLSGVSNHSTMQNPQHIYATAGSYQVSLIVISSTGCSDTIVKTVIIAAPPVVNFASATGCISDSTQFTSSAFVNVAALTSWLWSFGDGGTSTEIDPYHIYYTAGTYTAMLTVTDTSGCTNSVIHTVQVTAAPVAYFSYSATSCSNYPVQFNDLSTSVNGQIVSWHYDFGDGSDIVVNAPANPDVIHTYATYGNFNVTLVVSTNTGCENTFSHMVTVTAGPLAGFSYTSACPGSPAAFADQTSTNGGNPISSWMWNFGDPTSGTNNISTQQNPQHIYALPGTYTVNLMVINASGCMDTTINNVVVNPRPAVDFSYGAVNCQGSLTQFTVDPFITNLATVQSYDWNFGDGTAHSAIQNPSHAYGTSGVYTVILTITDITGCTNHMNRNLEIHPSPTAKFTYTSSCLNSLAHFTDHSFTTNGENITGWQWDFGDAGSADLSTLQNPSYTYSTAGTYMVTLTATSASGCAGTVVMPVQVNMGPTARFSYTADPCANGAVYFQDSSFAPQSVVQSWLWEFEPNHFSSLQNPTYVYHFADSCYNVKLIITDIQGCSNTFIKQVCVPSGLQFDFVSTEACIGDLTYFTPQLIAPAGDILTTYMWNFGDAGSGFNNTSTLSNPSHMYSEPGTYVVSLQVKDQNQCTNTIYRQAVVSAIPEPLFSFIEGNCDSTISFRSHTNTHGVTITKWVWQFGDGNSETILAPATPNISHLYGHPGLYYVTLSSTNENGCKASFSDTVRLYPCMLPKFRAIDTLICQHKAITFADSSTSSGPIANWLWDFGDNTTMTYNTPKANITHIYQSQGIYTVKLVISTQMVGGIKSVSATEPVIVNPSPIAKYSVEDVCIGTPAKFTNSTAGNGTQVSGYSWEFGVPGTLADTSSVKDATYFYQHSGAYDAALIATNTIGCSDTITHILKVNAIPSADFQFTSSCAGAQTHFTDGSDTVNAPLKTWKWDFIDSTGVIGHSGLANPDFLFKDEGTFRTQLIITDNNGCQDTIMKQVVSHPVPVSAFDITEDFENVQGQIKLNNGTLNATGYDWDFGNGSTSSADEPTITYNRDGTYKIKLISYNDFLCSDTLEMMYKLMFKGLFVPNAFSPANPISETLLFKPVGMSLKKYRVEVYNSWGNLLWFSTKLDEKGSPEESWDGTLNGILLPQDVYIWKIEAVFDDGTVWHSNEAGNRTNISTKTFGTVTLLR